MPIPTVTAASDREITRLRLALLRLARRIRQNARSELSPSQQSIVAILDRYGPLSPRKLAELEDVQPPSITRLVGSLEELGVVKRQPVAGDLRQVVVELTAAGTVAAARIHSKRDEWLANIVERLSLEQRMALPQVIEILERLLDDSPAAVRRS